MNHILIFPEDMTSNTTACLYGDRFTHITQQLKATVGSHIKVGIWQGNCGSAIITSIENHALCLNIHANTAPPSPSPIKLLLAMPRPKVLRRVLRSAIEHGVKEIHLINSWKVEKSYWQTPWLGEESLHTINKEALCLAKDTQPANIQCYKRFKPFVEDELPSLITGHNAFLAHPSSTPCPANIEKNTWLAIGPEGGFTDYEVAMLENAGFTSVSLGERILRVENAISSALGRLNPL